MSKFDFKLGNSVANAAGPMLTQPPVTWHGIDDAALAYLLKMSDANLATMQAAANRGGPITITGSREVTALDGGAIPPNANGTMNVTGVTYSGLCDIEDALGKGSLQLTRDLGRPHAANKDGKGGDQGHGKGGGGGRHGGN